MCTLGKFHEGRGPGDCALLVMFHSFVITTFVHFIIISLHLLLLLLLFDTSFQPGDEFGVRWLAARVKHSVADDCVSFTVLLLPPLIVQVLVIGNQGRRAVGIDFAFWAVLVVSLILLVTTSYAFLTFPGRVCWRIFSMDGAEAPYGVTLALAAGTSFMKPTASAVQASVAIRSS